MRRQAAEKWLPKPGLAGGAGSDLSQADPAQTAACLEKYVGQSIGVEACRQTLAELEKAPERLLPLLPAVLERVRLSPGLMEIDWRRKGRNGQDSALKKRG